MKKVTLSEIKESLKEVIKRESANYAIYLKVERVLKNFEGKAISKRIETEFRKQFPEHYCQLIHEYGMFHLNISPTNKFNYNEQLHFLIGYENENIVSIEPIPNVTRGFKYFSNCYGEAERERLEKNSALLADTAKLKQIVKALNNFVDSCKELKILHNYDSFYSFLKIAEIDSKQLY